MKRRAFLGVAASVAAMAGDAAANAAETEAMDEKALAVEEDFLRKVRRDGVESIDESDVLACLGARISAEDISNVIAKAEQHRSYSWRDVSLKFDACGWTYRFEWCLAPNGPWVSAVVTPVRFRGEGGSFQSRLLRERRENGFVCEWARTGPYKVVVGHKPAGD